MGNDIEAVSESRKLEQLWIVWFSSACTPEEMIFSGPVK